MESEIVLLECAPALPPGWLQIEFVGLAVDPSDTAILIVEHGPTERDLVEFVLPELTTSPSRHVIHTDRPAERFAVRLSRSLPGNEQARLTARRISDGARMLEAFRAAPAQTLTALGWRIAGKRIRARNRFRRILGSLPAMSYGTWLAEREPAWQAEIAELRSAAARWAPAPRITVAVDLADADIPDAATLASLESQGCPGVEVLLLAETTALRAEPPSTTVGWRWVEAPGLTATTRRARLAAAIRRASGSWLLLLRNGDTLAEGALLRIAHAASSAPDAVIIYGDHDVVDARGRRRTPAFKPDWNEPYFLAHDYIGRALAVSSAAARTCAALDEASDGLETTALVLELARGAARASASACEPIVHVARPLASRR